jgi:hypothetical protein
LLQNHKQKLEELAQEFFDYVDNVKIIKDLFDALPSKHSIASPYLNFRDALFHYRKMYDAANEKNNDSFIQQNACIEEHLNRGLKDFGIDLCNNYYAKIVYRMIKMKTKSINKDKEKKLRKLYHCFKNLVVEIRLSGESLQHFDENRKNWLPKMVKTISAFNHLLGIYPEIKRLYFHYSKEINNY